MEDSQVAAALSAELAGRIGSQRFELWFKTQSQLHVRGKCLTIRAANVFVLDWLRKNLAEDVRASWEAVAGQEATVAYDVGAVVEQCNAKLIAKSVAIDAGGGSTGVVAVAKPRAARKSQTCEVPAVNGAAELSKFVVGVNNEYAFRSAE